MAISIRKDEGYCHITFILHNFKNLLHVSVISGYVYIFLIVNYLCYLNMQNYPD